MAKIHKVNPFIFIYSKVARIQFFLVRGCLSRLGGEKRDSKRGEEQEFRGLNTQLKEVNLREKKKTPTAS